MPRIIFGLATGTSFIRLQVSLSSEAWVDVIQNGHSIVASDHSGDPNCPGLRKSVRFTLTAAPVTLEISNAPDDHVRIAITPWFVGAAPN